MLSVLPEHASQEQIDAKTAFHERLADEIEVPWESRVLTHADPIEAVRRATTETRLLVLAAGRQRLWRFLFVDNYHTLRLHHRRRRHSLRQSPHLSGYHSYYLYRHTAQWPLDL